VKAAWVVALVASGCAGELPPIAKPCAIQEPIEKAGCSIGLREAEADAAQLTRAPDGNIELQARWMAGYLHGRAQSRIHADRVTGRRMYYAGIALFVLSAIGHTIGLATLPAGGEVCCIGGMITEPLSLVEVALGMPLFIAGLSREVDGERWEKELELTGPIPVKPRPPRVEWHFQF
jgi:hypothetical protein